MANKNNTEVRYPCPDEIDGKPVVCVFEKDWQKKFSKCLEENKPFILVGPEEYLEKIYTDWVNGSKNKLLEDILLGSESIGVLALSGVSASTIATVIGIISGGTLLIPFTAGISEGIAIAALAALVGAVAIVIIVIALKIYKGDFKVRKVKLKSGILSFGLEFYPE